jgi:hypothetical protein
MNNQTRSSNLPSVQRKRLSVLIYAALLTLAGVGVVAQSQAQDAQLQPAPARISQAAIHADHETLQATQGRIKALNDKGVRVDNYHLAKAQCWLDTSFHEYTRNDRGGYPQAALDEAVKLISALENGADPGWETPLVNGAEKLRPDLWAKYDSLKKMEGFSCAAQATACAEVELVHAGNEMHDGGWRHAKPYIQIAEDQTAKAERREAECKQPEPAPQVEQFDLAADALFKFDRGDLAGLATAALGAEEHAVLDAVAFTLAAHQRPAGEALAVEQRREAGFDLSDGGLVLAGRLRDERGAQRQREGDN